MLEAPNTAIEVSSVTKRYRLFSHPGDRIKSFLTFGARKFYKDFVAVRNVSFQVKKGEVIGILGRNGSGKSTLLQLICGILKPNTGSMTVNGQISALLELGAGFNPEFTGRENIYFQGMVNGLSRAYIDRNFEAIEQFADIGEFIDQQVHTYSSGMFVRLAFAVAIHTQPDILIVDEALAVGDANFQRKCYARIKEMTQRGVTILLVSHDTNTLISLCDRALLMEKGELIQEGSPKEIVALYLAGSLGKGTTTSDQLGANPFYDPRLIAANSFTYPSTGAELSDIHIESPDGQVVNILRNNEEYLYTYRVKFTEETNSPRYGMMIKTASGIELGGMQHIDHEARLSQGDQVHKKFRFRCTLLPGTYYLNAGVLDVYGNYLHRVLDAVMFEVVSSSWQNSTGMIDFSWQHEQDA